MSCSCGETHAPGPGAQRPAPSPGQVAISGRLSCSDANQLKTLLEYLPSHIALSRAEPGCLFFDIAQTDDPLIWQVEELYADEAALDAHKARTAASIWADKSAGITRDLHRIEG